VTEPRLDTLFKVAGACRSVLILPHNDPDPDAIASALALRHLLERFVDVKTTIAYRGIIGRAENKALVHYLHNPLRRLTAEDLRQPGCIALVDTQPGAGNNALPRNMKASIVIDHHPLREATSNADFADIRTELGATSTMLTEYLQSAGMEPDPPLATALFYGIKTDTMGLARSGTPADTEAYFYLQRRIDVEAEVGIERAQVPAEYFKSLTSALQAAWVYDEVVISYIGVLKYPDLAAEMADLLLRLEGTQWVICMGVYQDNLHLAVRTHRHKGGAGKLVQAMVGDRGTAGGHGTMAGGQIPLKEEDPEHLAETLGKQALKYLKVPEGLATRPLI
jgi:nanoRNase/pAp phosphatase (c-di-AMP/oligoRNAs hydrolase)